MIHPRGVHHLAISTADIKTQIEFFSEVLGLELVALYWMHGVDGAWHGFLKLDTTSYLAFVQMDSIKGIDPVPGVTHAGNAGGPTAPGVAQHVAFDVDTLDDLLAMRDRIRANGVNVMGPIDHGMCHSIYFAGPEGLALEIATSSEAIDGDHWIDPEVVGLAGIDADELERYRNPSPITVDGPVGSVPNPPIDPEKPHLDYPSKVYEAIMSMPDEEFTARNSMPTPPVP